MREVGMQGSVAQGRDKSATTGSQDREDLRAGRRPGPSDELARLRGSTGNVDVDALLAPDDSMAGSARSVSGARERVAQRTAQRVSQELPNALNEATQTARQEIDQGAAAITAVTSSRPGATIGEATDTAIAAGRRLVPTGLSADQVMKVDGEIALRVQGIAAAAEQKVEAKQREREARAEQTPQGDAQPQATAQPEGIRQPSAAASKKGAMTDEQKKNIYSTLGIGTKGAERSLDAAGTSQEQATADRAQAAQGARAAAAAEKERQLVGGAALEERRQQNRLAGAVIQGMFKTGLPSQPEAGIPPQKYVRQELTRPLSFATDAAREQRARAQRRDAA